MLQMWLHTLCFPDPFLSLFFSLSPSFSISQYLSPPLCVSQFLFSLLLSVSPSLSFFLLFLFFAFSFPFLLSLFLYPSRPLFISPSLSRVFKLFCYFLFFLLSLSLSLSIRPPFASITPLHVCTWKNCHCFFLTHCSLPLRRGMLATIMGAPMPGQPLPEVRS